MKKDELSIDGNNFFDLEGFYDEVSEKVIPRASWGRNLDAFNDILRGGFGTPEEGFVFVWKNSETSRKRLGYEQTRKELRKRLAKCHHPESVSYVESQLLNAEQEVGETVFDWLIGIIRIHCAGGPEEEDGIQLQLM